MANYARLRLIVDPKTKKRELVISYESDADALPVEHENAHKKLAVGVAGKEAVKGATRISRGENSSRGQDDGGLPQAIKQGT